MYHVEGGHAPNYGRNLPEVRVCAAQIGLKGVQTGPRTQGARRASLSAVLALYVSERDGSERFKFTTSPLDQI